LTGLLPLADDSAQDLRVWLKVMPRWFEDSPDTAQTVWHVSSYRNERGEPLLKIWKIRDGAYLRFLYDDGTQFILDRSGTEVWATWLEPMTLEDAATYLLGPIFGLVLHLRGFVTLHASAVSIGGSAVAFVGPQGAGKSTTAAALASRGYPVLSDDITALHVRDHSLLIQSAFPQLKLWPNSVESLYGTSDSLPPLTPNWDKRKLDLASNGYRFQQEPLPLRALYFLATRSDAPAAPFIRSLSPQEGLLLLLGNGYVSLPATKQMQAREFDVMGRIAARVPLRQITPHAEPAHLSKLCEVFLDDCRQIIQS